MDHDKELARLRKFIYILAGMLFVIIVFVTTWASMEILRIKEAINDIKPSTQIIEGEDGQDGYTPQKGLDYDDGVDGSDGLNGKDGSDGQPGAQGQKGDTGANGSQGVQGKPGKTILLRSNPITALEECKFLGDDEWLPVQDCK